MMVQQLFHHRISSMRHAKSLEDKLNDWGSQGWKFSDASVLITRGGNCLTQIRSGYHFFDFFIILNQSEAAYDYRCCSIEKHSKPDKDIEQLVTLVSNGNSEGFELIKILHVSSIPEDPEYPTCGTGAHVLIFQRSKAVSI